MTQARGKPAVQTVTASIPHVQAKHELVHVAMEMLLARFVIDAMQIALEDGPHALVMYDASTIGIARSSKMLFGALLYWPMTGCGPCVSLSRRIGWKFRQAPRNTGRKESIEAQYGQEAVNIRFNAQYLHEFLHSVGASSAIGMHVKDASSAAEFRPCGTDGGRYRCVVLMPLRS